MMLGGRVVFEKFCFDPFFFPAAKNTTTQLFIQLVSLILGFCLLIFWLVVFLCSCSLSFSVSRCFSLCLLGVKTLLLAKTSREPWDLEMGKNGRTPHTPQGGGIKFEKIKITETGGKVVSPTRAQPGHHRQP